MKLITAMIQPYKLQDVKDALFKVNVTKMTVSNALGCGQQKGYDETYRGVVHARAASATAKYSSPNSPTSSASARVKKAKRLLDRMALGESAFLHFPP